MKNAINTYQKWWDDAITIANNSSSILFLEHLATIERVEGVGIEPYFRPAS